MADYSAGATLRGNSVRGNLYQNGSLKDVVAAKEIDVTFETDELSTDLLSRATTQIDEYPNKVSVSVKSARKGNGFLEMYADQYLASLKNGKPMPKFTFNVTFIDVNTNTTKTLKIINGALKPDSFASGGRAGESTEGFSIKGDFGSLS